MNGDILEHTSAHATAPRKWRPLAAFLRDLAALNRLLSQTVQHVLRGRVDREAVIAASHSAGNGSMLFISVTMTVTSSR